MKNQTNESSQTQVQKKELSPETLKMIGDLIFSYQVHPFRLKSDLIDMVLLLNQDDCSVSVSLVGGYVTFLDRLIDQVYFDAKAEEQLLGTVGDKKVKMDHITDKTIRLITDLWQEKDVVFIKTDLLQIYEAIDLASSGLDRKDKEGPLMLITWLNDFLDSIYTDIHSFRSENN